MRAKILVVDDEPDARKALRSILEDEGFLVETGAGGRQAIELLEAERFDLLITDMKMPQMSGIELVKKAKELDPSIEGIVTTGAGSVENAVESLKHGALDYLTKPFEDIDKFVASVNLALERRRLRKENELLVSDLNAERKRLSVILQSIADGIISTDRELRVVFVNKAAEKLTGWPRKEALGRPLGEVFQAAESDTREPVADPARQAVDSRKVVRHLEYAILHAKDGRKRFVTFTAAPVRNNEGELLGAVLIFKDVTNRKIIEEELIRAKKLETAGVLAGGIAHDFNNLLTIIMGNINMAKIELRSDAHIFDYLRDAESASLQARDLVKKFTTFTTGGAPVRKRLEIKELIQNIVQVCLSGSNLECQMKIPEKPWGVFIDPKQIQQVLNNVLMNAAEAMPSGGKIAVSCQNHEIVDPESSWVPLKKGKYVKLTITDQGSGISGEDLEKVFDPYFSTKKRGEQRGMGLGLTIARSIVVKNEGFIRMESRSPGGTSVHIYLPAAPEEHARAVEKIEESRETPSKRFKVLVMDDDRMMRDVVSVMLKILKHDVELASKGEEALEMYVRASESGQPFDAVILDLTVRGGMGGKETLEKLLQLDPGVKAIVSSGHSNSPLVTDFSDYGFKGALPKPYLKKELENVLNKVVHGCS